MDDAPRMLVDLGAALERAARERAGHSFPLRRSTSRILRVRAVGRALGLASAIGVVVVVAGVILLAGHVGRVGIQTRLGSGHRADHSPSAPGSAAPDIRRAFAAFRRPRTESDAIPSAYHLGRIEHAYGVDPKLSRLVLNTRSVKMWILPARDYLCAVSKGPHGAIDVGYCAPSSVAETRGLVTGTTAAGRVIPDQMWFGVLPERIIKADAVRTGGPEIPVSINSDGGFVQPIQRPVGLLLTARDGVVIAIPAGPSP